VFWRFAAKNAFLDEIAPNAERREVLGDFRPKRGFPVDICRRAHASKLSANVGGKAYFGAEIGPKGVPKGLLGDFGPKTPPVQHPVSRVPQKGVFLGVSGKNGTDCGARFSRFLRLFAKIGAVFEALFKQKCEKTVKSRTTVGTVFPGNPQKHPFLRHTGYGVLYRGW